MADLAAEPSPQPIEDFCKCFSQSSQPPEEAGAVVPTGKLKPGETGSLGGKVLN